MAKLKDLSQKEELLSGGHRLCAGCAASIVIRQILHAAGDNHLVVSCATGCLEVATTIYPYTAWRCSYIHNAFENSAATISGVEAAYRSLKRQGKIKHEFRFIGLGGDGGTYDIGFQSLSGAMERGHRMLYVCYDNQAYMNTGIQRSSATPKGASTTTAPAGEVVPGKQQFHKDLTGCMAAHKIPYVAQASPSHWNDLVTKIQKAIDTDGPSFINIIAPCPRGWRFPSDRSIEIARLAVETCFWPLYEVENRIWEITYKPKEKKPLVEWIKAQGRFKHLFSEENKHILDELQQRLDQDWAELQAKEEVSKQMLQVE